MLVLVAMPLATAASAETAPEPGQTMAIPAPTGTLFAAGPAALLPSQQTVSIAPPNRNTRAIKSLWWTSVVALAAATSMDAASSWGHREANGLLASPGGNFGGKGLTLKFAGASAILAPQALLHRRTNLLKWFALSNAAAAGMYSGVAFHNYQVTGRLR